MDKLAHGLWLVGTWGGTSQVTRANGEAVSGLLKVEVRCKAGDGHEVARQATYNRLDRDSGEVTWMARRLEEANLQLGEPVAVRVSAASKPQSQWVNLTAHDVQPLVRKPAVAAAPQRGVVGAA